MIASLLSWCYINYNYSYWIWLCILQRNVILSVFTWFWVNMETFWNSYLATTAEVFLLILGWKQSVTLEVAVFWAVKFWYFPNYQTSLVLFWILYGLWPVLLWCYSVFFMDCGAILNSSWSVVLFSIFLGLWSYSALFWILCLVLSYDFELCISRCW